MSAIHGKDEYGGFEVTIEAKCGAVVVPLRIDLTSGDIITPAAVDYSFSTLLEKKKITIRAYNIDALLAEKFETMITRGVGNTRSKDFYDVFIISKMYKINFKDFAEAAIMTFTCRETSSYLDSRFSIIESIQKDRFMTELWLRYQKANAFARNITFEETIDSLRVLAEAIKKEDSLL